MTALLLMLTPPAGNPVGRTDPVRPLPQIGPPPLSAWHEIQPDLDRSNGHIVDEPTYQLDRAAALRSLDRLPFDPGGYMQVFRRDRDHWLSIDQRQLDQRHLAEQSTAQRREAQMQLREYQLFIDASSDPGSAVAAQAEADRLQLEKLRTDRDERVKQAGADREAIAKIDANYQRERARILGFNSASTQPTTQRVER